MGTIVGAEISRKYGAMGLPDDTISLKFNGSAGQSFAAFVPKGMTLKLEGDANDYLGKGLSGGKIVVYPAKTAHFASHENIIIGNTAFYGATSGEAFISGVSGERFAVCNSGVNAVIEGVGDHACEYMTGGTVIVLGATGKNFAAGMSGGIAYVYDADGKFPSLCNTEMAELTSINNDTEVDFVRNQIFRHVEATDSKIASSLLLDWDDTISKFLRVIPTDYRIMLDAQEEMMAAGLSRDEAEMAAFTKVAA